MPKVHRNKYVRSSLLVLLLLALTGLFYYSTGTLAHVTAGENDVENTPENLKTDPLNKAWEGRIVPKQRLLVSYLCDNNSVCNFVGTSEDIVCVKSAQKLSECLGEDYFIFASSSAEGKILATVSGVSPDFYGITEFSNVPKNALVSSYLGRDTRYHKGFYNRIWLVMREGDELMQYQLPEEYGPAYSFEFKADGSWIDAPSLEKNTAHDIVACDWDGDGYSDYALTYIQAEGGKNSNTYVRILLIDGKSLYNRMKNGTGDVKITPVNGDKGSGFITGKNVVGGLTGIKPANSCRMAAGDFDGDGRQEIALYYTLIHGGGADQSRPNQLEVYRINSAGAGLYASELIYSTKDGEDGGSLKQNDSVGLAAGDINNDGVDELALVYAESAATFSLAELKMIIYGYADGTMKKLVDIVNTGQDSYNAHVTNASPSPLNAAIADLDGDGFGELVWTTAKDEEGFNLYVFVNKWNSLSSGNKAISGMGSIYRYCLKGGKSRSIASVDWILNDNYFNHSLCTGDFDYPTGQACVKQPQQIAICHVGVGAPPLSDFGVFSWNRDNGLVALSTNNMKDLTGPQRVSNVGPVVAAVDIRDESMVLGEPSVFSVQDNIELQMVTQAPPKHWDVVSAKGSGLSGKSGFVDSDDNVTMDAFALCDDNSSYYTKMGTSESVGSSSSTTNTSSGTWGAAASFKYYQYNQSFRERFVYGTRQKESDPTLDAGIKYSGESSYKNMSGYSSSASHSFTTVANRDDEVYFRANCYNICRYPILWPLSRRTTHVESGDAISEDMQNYIQFVVPTEVGSTFSATSGKGVEWYEPDHDTYNLFTYPKKLRDITGYPQGQEAKLAADPLDPWAYVNGKLYIDGTQNLIGGPDKNTFTLDATSKSTNSEYTHIQQTLAPHVYFHPKFGRSHKKQINIDLDGDYTWGTDTTTSTEASKMLTATISTGGLSTYYQSSESPWSLSDARFYSDIAYFTQDDGAFCVGFAVSDMKNANSKMWGSASPYNTHPDPGFVLPYRWNTWDVKTETMSSGAFTSRHYLEKNTNNDRYTLRGLKMVEDSNVGAPTGKSDGVPVKLLKLKSNYNVALRLVNYSFVRTEPFAVKFYYQPIDSVNAAPEFDVSKLGEPIAVDNVPLGVPGRTNQVDNTDNWVDVKINGCSAMTKNVGLGYFHAVIVYSGDQLSADNDHGCYMVGTYDPEKFSGIAQTASSALSASSIAASERPDMSIVSVKAYELDSKGVAAKEPSKITSDLRYKKLRIDVTAKFTGGKIIANGVEREIKYLPLFRAALFGGKKDNYRAILGARELPLLKDGETYAFSFRYDPAKTDASNGASVRAFSPLLHSLAQKSQTSQEYVLWNALESGGSGGCSSGFAALALLAFVPMLGGRRRGKK